MNAVLYVLKRYKKAVGGGLAGGLIAFAYSLPDGVTAGEWGGVILGIVGGAMGVAITPANAPKAVLTKDQRGGADVTQMIAAVALVTAVAALCGVRIR